MSGMTIDIIQYTSEQLAALTTEQIIEVKRVQLSKNRLTRNLEEKKRAAKYKLVKAGVFRSQIWEQICLEFEQSYTQEIDNLREGLLFYLHYGDQTSSGESNPYPLDYSLSVEERAIVVRDYYNGAYTDPQERYEAFLADKAAKSYVGEMYGALVDYFYADIV
ncbi:MAG: hypothetical protein IJX98_05005 [Clostridia bacterium]|nr:hypothetical protein [Clostridia bacterium]